MAAQPNQGLAEPVAGRGQVRVGPKQIGDLLARMASVRIKRQKRKERGGLLGREAVDGPVTTAGAQDTKQVDAPSG